MKPHRPSIVLFLAVASMTACINLGAAWAHAADNVEILEPASNSTVTIPAPAQPADELLVPVVARFNNGYTPLSATIYIKQANGQYTVYDGTTTFTATLYQDGKWAYRINLPCESNGDVVKIVVDGYWADAEQYLYASDTVENVTVQVDD